MLLPVDRPNAHANFQGPLAPPEILAPAGALSLSINIFSRDEPPLLKDCREKSRIGRSCTIKCRASFSPGEWANSPQKLFKSHRKY